MRMMPPALANLPGDARKAEQDLHHVNGKPANADVSCENCLRRTDLDRRTSNASSSGSIEARSESQSLHLLSVGTQCLSPLPFCVNFPWHSSLRSYRIRAAKPRQNTRRDKSSIQDASRQPAQSTVGSKSTRGHSSRMSELFNLLSATK